MCRVRCRSFFLHQEKKLEAQSNTRRIQHIKEVLKRYKEIPNEIVEKGDNAIQLMEGVVRLSGTIRTSDAKELQAFSDKMGNTSVVLQKLVDSDAIFTINNTLKQKARYIGMTEDEATNWFTTWSHSDLAKWVTVI